MRWVRLFLFRVSPGLGGRIKSRGCESSRAAFGYSGAVSEAAFAGLSGRGLAFLSVFWFIAGLEALETPHNA